MPLTSGMLDKLKSLASEQDEHLLKVNMSGENYVYGYLREVGSDYFVVNEVRAVRTSGNLAKWPKTEFRVETKKVGLTTLALSTIESWTELPSTASVPYGGG